MENIKVDYDSIQEEVSNLNYIENELTSRIGRKKELGSSKGETIESAIMYYNKVMGMYETLNKLVRQTKQVLNQAGIKFEEGEKEAIGEYNEIE